MPREAGLEHLEERAYRETYSDGLIDIFVGLSLVWIGAAWIWLEDFAGLAGVLPAVFLTSMIALRKRFLEDRTGYVKFGKERRQWERRNLAAVLTGGVLMFLVGVAVFLAVTQTGSGTDWMAELVPGLLAWLLALGAVVLAFLFGVRRLFLYAGALTVAGAVTVWADANPGWPLLTSGVVMLAVGIVMTVRFVRRYPAAESV